MTRVGWVAYLLRLPEDLKSDLERLALRNDRSLNSQIVYLLRQSVEGWRR